MKSDQVYNYVERLNELLKADLRLASTNLGIQPVHLEILLYLSKCNRFSDTHTAVTEYLGQTKGTVSETLKLLEKKGLLSKESDTDDKRVTHLKVTDRGRKLINKAISSNLLTNACDALSEYKKNKIATTLKILLEAVVTENNIKTFGVCNSCRHHTSNKGDRYFCNLILQPLLSEDTQLICRDHEAP